MSRGHLVLEHAIEEIQEGLSYRRDLGDLGDLIESIRRAGLLSPIVITTDGILISGRRRLAAMRELGHRTVPVWVAAEVSDRLSTVLAIQDENVLQKMLSPIEQAELYQELKTLLAEENKRKQKATRFGAHPDNDEGQHGGAESAPPQTAGSSSAGKTRAQAARAVTGRNSHGMLEQVAELQAIAAGEDQAPLVRQAAAEALIELNADGKVNGRYLRVKHAQALTGLERTAASLDAPEPVKAAARSELERLRQIENPRDAVKEATRALDRITKLHDASSAEPVAWKDADPHLRAKHTIRKLVDLLRREHGWWDRNDPVDFGRHATADQWELLNGYVAGAILFLEKAAQGRESDALRVA